MATHTCWLDQGFSVTAAGDDPTFEELLAGLKELVERLDKCGDESSFNCEPDYGDEEDQWASIE